MAKSNAQRQADWRKRAQNAREFQRQHQQRTAYTPPPGYVLISRKLYDEFEAKLKEMQPAPTPTPPMPSLPDAIMALISTEDSPYETEEERNRVVEMVMGGVARTLQMETLLSNAHTKDLRWTPAGTREFNANPYAWLHTDDERAGLVAVLGGPERVAALLKCIGEGGVRPMPEEPEAPGQPIQPASPREPKTELGQPLIPITAEEIRELHSKAPKVTCDWLSVYAGWTKKDKKLAYKLFLNLGILGELDEPIVGMPAAASESESLKDLWAKVSGETKDWLAVYAGWSKMDKDLAYKVFLNLNAIEDI